MLLNRRQFIQGAVGGAIAGKVPLDTLPFNKSDILASVCKDSFFEFVRRFWDVVCAETPVWNWHIEYLCGELERVARREHAGLPKEYDLIINISPGSTKSIIVSIMFPAWVWTWYPSASFVGCSYTAPLAERMSRINRQVVKSEKYAKAFPKTHIIPDQDAKSNFVNISKGERMCVGVDGDIVGRHANFILIDDPINPKGARSEANIISANVFINETLRTRKKNKANTPTIMIMQRLHENDPTGMMLKEYGEDKIRHICLPSEVTDMIKPAELRERYVDGLMDANRLPWSVLEEEKKRGDFYYSGQFLQNPVPLGGGMFKTERIAVDYPPQKWTQRVRYWDKAGTLDGGAYTVGVLMGKNCDGRYWILDVVRGQWDSAARERIIKQTAEIDGKAVIVGVEQEGGSGGKESAENTARNLDGYRVRLDHPTGDKALRADPFSSQVNAHNVSMVRGEWNREYLDELKFFPSSTYKDQVDASSGAYNILSQPIIRVGGGLIT